MLKITTYLCAIRQKLEKMKNLLDILLTWIYRMNFHFMMN